MAPVGRCAVCFSTLLSTNVVALTKCGHTFHKDCVRPWIATGKACPTCRMKTTTGEILKLFFDAPGPEDSFFLASQEDSSTRIAHLTAQIEELEKVKEVESQKNQELEQKVKSQSRTISNLEKNGQRAERLAVIVSQLEGNLQNQNALKKKLEETEQKLKASEFYRLIKAGDGNNGVWEKYLGPSGIVNASGFETLFNVQYKQLRRKYDEQQIELMNTAKLLAEEKKKKEANQRVILDLRDQLKKAEEKLMEKNVVLTPRGVLKDILAYSPPKDRRSLGFSLDESAEPVPYSKDIIASAMKKRNKGISSIVNQQPSSKKFKKDETQRNRFTFDDSESDPDENIIGHFDVPTPISRFGGTSKVKPFSTAIEDKYPSIKKARLEDVFPGSKTRLEDIHLGLKPKNSLPVMRTKSMFTETKETNPSKPSKFINDDSVIYLS